MTFNLKNTPLWIFFHKQRLWSFLFIANCLIFLYHFPVLSISLEPATGGDTGSHFYTLWRLYHNGFRVWDPNRLMGEIHLVHYFPIPFFFMRFLSYFLPLGLAYNLGIIFPIFVLPLATAYAFKALKTSNLTVILAWSSIYLFYYNESFSIWGGNGLSTLAGQFVHLYALIFFILFIGFAAKPFISIKDALLLSLLTGLIASTHSYVFLFLPPLFLILLCNSLIKKNFIVTQYILLSGGLGLVNGLWFLVPQIQQAPWTYPFAMKWSFEPNLSTIIPNYLFLLLFIGILLFILHIFLSKDYKRVLFKSLKKNLNLILILLTLIFTGLIYFFIFPYVGLIDARSLPQIYLGLTFFLILFICILLESLNKKTSKTLSIVIVALILGFTLIQNKNYSYWAAWNFSGWSSKPLFSEARKIMKFLEKNESQTRVLYEHDPNLVNSGTTRIFELLPAFSNRPTLESLYIESTHTSYIAYDLQARISQHPSCPDSKQYCPKLELSTLKEKLLLTGTSEIIASTHESRRALSQLNYLKSTFESLNFSIFSLKESLSLAEVISKPLKIISSNNWRYEFQSWYKNYSKDSDSFLIFKKNNQKLLTYLERTTTKENTDSKLSSCKVSAKIEINQIQLTSSCPGHPHLIKAAYSPFLKAKDGSETFLVSPGFIGVLPKNFETQIYFYQPKIWLLFDLISLLSLLFCLWYIILLNKKKMTL